MARAQPFFVSSSSSSSSHSTKSKIYLFEPPPSPFPTNKFFTLDSILNFDKDNDHPSHNTNKGAIIELTPKEFIIHRLPFPFDQNTEIRFPRDSHSFTHNSKSLSISLDSTRGSLTIGGVQYFQFFIPFYPFTLSPSSSSSTTSPISPISPTPS